MKQRNGKRTVPSFGDRGKDQGKVKVKAQRDSQTKRPPEKGRRGADTAFRKKAAEGNGAKEQNPQEKRRGLGAGELPFEIRVSVETEEQLQQVLEEKAVSLVYLDEGSFSGAALEDFMEQIHAAGKKAGLRLRRIPRDGDFQGEPTPWEERSFSMADAILVRSFDEVGAVVKCLSNRAELVFDYTVYAYNSEAAEQLRLLGADRLTYPIELNRRELYRLSEKEEDSGKEMLRELLIYGHLPMMVSANCIQKTLDRCDHGNRILQLTDRMGKTMAVRCYCRFCYNQIYNAEPLVLYDLYPELIPLKPRSVRYDFSVENRNQVKAVLEGLVPERMTRGHFHHGIE